MSPVLLGVDLATAGARVVAVDGVDGTVLAQRAAALPAPHRPGAGVSEQDARYAEVVEVLIAGVAADLGDAAVRVAALCVTGTSGTVVPCGSNGRPVGPAVLYDDQRARAQQDQLRSVGAPAATTAALARIGWLAVGSGAALYLHTPDVVTAALAGAVLATDTSHALKSGIDPVAGTWPTALLDLLDIEPGALPELVHPGTVIGAVSEAVADRVGLPRGIRIVAGMTDGCTAQIAAGAVVPGDTVGVLGTTLVLKGVSLQALSDSSGAVYSHFAPDGRFWPGGASNVGAGALAREFPGRDLAQLDAAAARRGPAGVLRYPLSGTGERFPLVDPAATGFVVGTAADEVEAYRAVLDGVAFTERFALEILGDLGLQRGGSHRLAGGASRSAVWNRIRATVLDAVVTGPTAASSGVGAAVLAAVGLSGRPLAEVVAELVPDGPVLDPDPSSRKQLDEQYHRWRTELLHRHSDLTPALTPA